MEIVRTVAEMRALVKNWQVEGHSIGLVPTMGYLHQGHISLIQQAVAGNERVVVSIFVNPIQFGPAEDLDRYPRDLDADCRVCREAGVDAVFHPEPGEMYRPGFNSFVEVEGLTDTLCGQRRPGHFSGVCTVVNKLLNIVQPQSAYFGQKDAQQLAVIRRMAADLDMNVEIVGCPIVREPDGLAMSSRNAYLSPQERSAALCLSKALNMGRVLLLGGEQDIAKVRQAILDVLNQESLAKVDYVEVVDNETMQPVETLDHPILCAVAVYIGNTRLIDNFVYPA